LEFMPYIGFTISFQL